MSQSVGTREALDMFIRYAISERKYHLQVLLDDDMYNTSLKYSLFIAPGGSSVLRHVHMGHFDDSYERRPVDEDEEDEDENEDEEDEDEEEYTRGREKDKVATEFWITPKCDDLCDSSYFAGVSSCFGRMQAGATIYYHAQEMGGRRFVYFYDDEFYHAKSEERDYAIF